MNVGIVLMVIIGDRLQHRLWLLRSGGIVEVDQWFVIYELIQDGKRLFHFLGIDHASNFPSITATNSCCTSLTGIAVKTEPKKPRITKRSASALRNPRLIK